MAHVAEKAEVELGLGILRSRSSSYQVDSVSLSPL